jgi:hypothetical protein
MREKSYEDAEAIIWKPHHEKEREYDAVGGSYSRRYQCSGAGSREGPDRQADPSSNYDSAKVCNQTYLASIKVDRFGKHYQTQQKRH